MMQGLLESLLKIYSDWRAPMGDEPEGRGRRAPAPPPRQGGRPPEPRPRTLDQPPSLSTALPAPPRLIRPSEHLAIVERSMHRPAIQAPPLQSPEALERRRTQSPDAPRMRPRAFYTEPARPHTAPEVQDRRIVEAERRPQERRPHPLVPSVTVLQGPRAPLSPAALAHRSVAPPPLRMPAPQHVSMRMPQSRRDIQVWE